MKKTYLYMAAAALVALSTSCSEDDIQNTGEGSLRLTTAISSDVKVESRADDAELRQSCLVWISNSEGKLVRRYEGLDNVPESIDLINGSYVAEAWAGDSVSASFSDRYFYGYQPFEINSAATEVKLTAKIANVVASVVYADGLDEVLSDYTMTVGHSRGSLIFDGRDDRKGYFMMPSTDTDLTYELRGKQINGAEFVLNGTIPNAQRATEYVLNVYFEQHTTEIGGAVLTIRVDKKEIAVDSTIEILTAPKIEGYGFNIADEILGEESKVGRKSVYIASADELRRVELESDYFPTILPIFSGATSVNLLGMSEAAKDALAQAGINFLYKDVEEGTLLQINFEETFTNALKNGEYAIAIAATDAEGKTSTATLRFNISDAPVQTVAVAEETIEMDSAVLRGFVAKDGVESVGFNYALEGSNDWTYVQAVPVARSLAAGTEFVATITGLRPNKTYKYASVTDNFVGNEMTFVTKDGPQMPNSSFEDWYTYNTKILVPGTQYPGSWWDTGNHGSSTMSKNVTQSTTAYTHSGTYSAMLKSQFVGVGTLGKFAAGNIFVGQYLATDGTDGVLGFGKPFTSAPEAVTAWVRYDPGVGVSKKGANDSYIAVGQTDEAQIYVALVDDQQLPENEYNGVNYPCLIKTKTSDQKLFNPEASNIIAYGSIILGKTNGTGLEQVTINLEYRRPADKDKVANIIFVASASRYGDFFSGGEGSTLYLDDVHLEY